MKNKITNTEHELSEIPVQNLLRNLAPGGPAAIEAQERRGQEELVQSEVLPSNIEGRREREIRAMGAKILDGEKDVRDAAHAVLERAGVRFLGPVEGDPLFVYVKLPAGWKKVATEHDMHVELCDQKGRVRASIFYKAAYYDRRATITTVRRFSYSLDYDHWKTSGECIVRITDCKTIIHSTEAIKFKYGDEQYWKVSEDAEARAKKWLEEHYPQWNDAGAYWDLA